ncbi:PEP-utilizing enzyme [Acidimicrobiaceae bacterium]|nr:PEP-utilizing enzyme [Acidimicrobiaceae bacterium]
MQNDDISSKNNLNPQDQLNYKNKAKNLEFVKNNSNIKIPYFKEITFDDFENIEETLGKFSEQIIIRSNSSKEDTDDTSSAGKFLSIGPIDKNDISLIKKSWNEVLQSYEKDDNNTVIFQDYVDGAKSVSVLTSYKVGTDSPYRTFSTYYGSQTDAVTSGRYNKIKNFFIHRSLDNLPEKFKEHYKFFKIQNQLENLFGNKQLDIEIVIDHKEEPLLLQVRPLMGKTIKKEPIMVERSVIDENVKRYKELIPTTDDRFGTNQIYSNMSDMNPAEMIGKKPDNIAFSLYRFMFTDTTWNKQRGEFGYRIYSGGKLMELFNNVAYINVNHSLNSFLTRNIKNETCEKIINYQLNKLETYPHLHDSIEFDISRSSYTFETDEKFGEEYKNIIDSKEIIQWHHDLIEIDSFNSSTLHKNNEIILDAFSNLDDSFQYLDKENIKFVRDNMALPFTHHSRLGFVYFAQLNNFLKNGVINEEEKQNLLLSVNSISTKMKQDAYRVKTGDISLNDFLSIYGHVRAGNYNLSSSNLKSNISFAESLINTSNEPISSEPLKIDIFKKIDDYFNLNKISYTSENWVEMFQLAVSTRENSKFYYTKGIDGILSEIEEKNISDRELFKLLDFEYNDMNTFNQKIEDTLMPDVITSSDDFYAYEEMNKDGNYIGQGTVSGEILFLDGTENNRNNLDNKIIVIPAADPGWDWIFNYKIKSLITEFGGPNSHMAIRCAEHNIPAILGIGEKNFSAILNSKNLVVDFSNENFTIL